MTKSNLALVGGADIEGLDNLSDDQRRRFIDPKIVKAMRRFITRLLDQSVVSLNTDFIPCPVDMKIYQQNSNGEAFTPENVLVHYVKEQMTKSFTGVEILAKLKAESGKVNLLGAEHAFFLLQNPWRINVCLNRFAIAFFGTVYCSSTRINDKIQAYEQFVIVLENDENEDPVVRLKPLNETFDKFYPIALLP